MGMADTDYFPYCNENSLGFFFYYYFKALNCEKEKSQSNWAMWETKVESGNPNEESLLTLKSLDNTVTAW